ncbi:MAG: ABC transporter permease [Phycisphaerae bacterium]|nr:ABC transporter permease [Phycisphaerae bacterium]
MLTNAGALTLLGMTRRNLFRQRVRTLLTVMGVSLGVVAIVAFHTLMRGVWESVEIAISTGGADLMVFKSGVAADLFSILDEQKTRDLLEADEHVAETSACLFHILPIAGQPFTLLFGLHADEFVVRDSIPVSGRRIEGPDEIMLGVIAAKLMEKKAGDTLIIAGQTFTVAGVFETEVVFYNGGILMDLERMQQLIDRQGLVTAFLVKLKEGADRDAAVVSIEERDPDVVAVTGAADYNKVDRGLDMGNDMVWLVSIMAILIGSIIVMNTMWMSVFERTREIGLLRAVGWSSYRVTAMVLIEATFVGIMACIVGSILGAGLAELTTVLPVSQQFNSPVYDLPPFLLALAVAVTLSLLGAALPAWRATRISPVEALRYE